MKTMEVRRYGMKTDSIRKGCEDVRGFLNDLEKRGQEGLSSEARELIEGMKSDLTLYLFGEEKSETKKLKDIKIKNSY